MRDVCGGLESGMVQLANIKMLFQVDSTDCLCLLMKVFFFVTGELDNAENNLA